MGEKKSKTNGQFGIYAFGKDILIYSLGNGLLLLFSFIQVFIIPKYLTVEGYGYWQLFILYSTYVGILHVGFIDGILVRWAGKELARMGDEIRTAFRFLILEQVVIIVPVALLLYFLIRPPLQWLWLMILAYAFIMNLVTFFMFTAQAIRRFGLLTTVNVGRGLAFLLLIIVLFATGYFNYHYVVLALLTSFLLALFTFAFWFRKYLWGEKPAISPLWACGKENISIGIFVLLGNFAAVLFLTIDRLMVSSFFTIEQFAVYAFATAIVIAIYMFVRAVSEVFFPYLSRAVPQLQNRAYQIGKLAIVLVWAAILAGYFPLARLIEYYLPHYIASLPIMQILLCTVGFGSLIQILHVNYYKAYRMQRQYFLWGLAALALSSVLSVLAIKVWGTLESVAIAVSISFAVWYIVNELSLRPMVGKSHRDGIYITAICSYVAAFWLSSILCKNVLVQTGFYLCLFFFISWLFFRHQVKDLLPVLYDFRKIRILQR
jgi:O-antigen/teichoic acid export membrane protein